MSRQRLRRMFEKNRNELRGLVLREYPGFVLRDAEGPSEPPAFVFHGEGPDVLEPLFDRLTADGYQTLGADAWCERREGKPDDGRAVLLTFDDGVKSLYTEVYPALCRFGLRAVAYLVPGMTPEPDDGGPWSRALCHWDEIREMHESGVVDFQSHSSFHHSVAVSERVVDFARPGLALSFLDGDHAPLLGEGDALRRSDALPAGTPLHAWGPRYGAAPAFREAPEVVRACVERVAEEGGDAFFEASDWRARLRSTLAEARRSFGGPRRESPAEQRAAILADLLESQRSLEARLRGKRVRHFCFPWYQGSQLAADASREAGFLSNAWGSLPPGYAARALQPLAIPRLSPVYAWRLPGRGRRPLRDVLRDRLAVVTGRTG